MDKIRHFLWDYLGITLDRETWIVGSIVVLGTLGVLGCGIGFAITHAPLLFFLTLVCGSVLAVLSFAGSYALMRWNVASKEERQKIEEEVSLNQWRRRARHPHYEP